MLPTHFRGVNWQDLSDDVLDELLDVIEAVRMRRWKARRTPSFVDELRTQLKKEGGEPIA